MDSIKLLVSPLVKIPTPCFFGSFVTRGATGEAGRSSMFDVSDVYVSFRSSLLVATSVGSDVFLVSQDATTVSID